MPRRYIFLLVLILLAFTIEAGPRRRAVASPGVGPDETTPHGWLAANAHILSTIELGPDTADLFPLRSMIGSAPVVGLGDVTHGTHEFYTVKLRVIDYLVREMGFDVLGLEAPFPLTERINTYIQTGVGDPRALLGEMYPITYFFWDAEEFLDVVEWMREYNVHRGDRAPVHVVGVDVTQPDAASSAVVAYLRSVDPAAAVDAEEDYACARESSLIITALCQSRAIRIRNSLAAREAELTTLSSAQEYREALHNARVVVQSRWPYGPNRDQAMAENALLLRQHRGSSRKMILWAHSAHLSETSHPLAGARPMGKVLAEHLESDYFSITTLTAAGTFRQWQDLSGTRQFSTITRDIAPLDPNSYESHIRQRGEPYLLIPFRKVLPQWLTTPAPYNFAGSVGNVGTEGLLPTQYDAAIFIDTTTPLRPLTH